MASHILETLEKAEEVWRAKSPEWKRKMSRWEAWQTRQKNNERLAQKAAARKRDPGDEMLQEDEDHSWESSFDPNDPFPTVLLRRYLCLCEGRNSRGHQFATLDLDPGLSL